MSEEERLGLGARTTIGGRYRIERKLGSGGMASVWLARDERTGREVAIKLLADALAHDSDYVRRFHREAEIASGFDHRNVVEALGSGRAGGRPFLVMEHVPGGTLADRLAAGEPQDVDRRAEGLLGGLAHIHAAGVVHRDVKPHNVLFAEDGRIKLTDFGIARTEEATRITRTGEVIGTLSYMAPEVQRGEPATVRSDLYSRGMVLKECAGPALADGSALAALVTMLTAEDPGDRPPSAGEALSILRGDAPARRTETMATRRMAGGGGALAAGMGGRRIGIDPRWLLGAAAAGAVVLLVLLMPRGGEEAPQSGAGAERPAIGNAEPAPAEPAPAAEDPPAETTAPGGENVGAAPSCDALEERKDGLKDQKKAAEERVKDDKDAKEAVKERFKAREDALKERIDACKEAEKEAEDD